MGRLNYIVETGVYPSTYKWGITTSLTVNWHNFLTHIIGDQFFYIEWSRWFALTPIFSLSQQQSSPQRAFSKLEKIKLSRSLEKKHTEWWVILPTTTAGSQTTPACDPSFQFHHHSKNIYNHHQTSDCCWLIVVVLCCHLWLASQLITIV